jgi:hypothetical protein
MIQDTKFLDQTDLAKFSSANNNIDMNLYNAGVLFAQNSYIKPNIGNDLFNELQKLIYIDKLQTTLVGAIVANVLTVTFQEGADIEIGNELVGVDVKNNTKIVSGSGPYTIEIDGNPTVQQDLTSREFTLINDNVILMRYIKDALTLWTLYSQIQFFWSKINAQGVTVPLSDKLQSITHSDLTLVRKDIETMAIKQTNVLVNFLEENAATYPLYVPLDDNCCNKKKVNRFGGVIFY